MPSQWELVLRLLMAAVLGGILVSSGRTANRLD